MTVGELAPYSGWTSIGGYRVDAEYYRPEHQKYFATLAKTPHRRLGEISTMRRPQYRTTSSFAPGKLTNGVKFLSPTEIVNQRVDWSAVREVAAETWDQYPAGRATQGDLLLEVKGDATKVHLLAGGIPPKAMISGSFQQIRLNVPQEEWYVFAVLLSNVWHRQRRRLQSNINIKYVDKEALQTVVIPWPRVQVRNAIGSKVRASDLLRSTSVSQWQSTMDSIATTWAQLAAPSLGRYSSTFLEVGLTSRRIDADYYRDADLRIREQLREAGFVELDSVCSWIGSGCTPRREGDAVRIVGVGSLRTPVIKPSAERYCEESNAVRLRNGDVLLCSAAHDPGFIGRLNSVVGEDSNLVASSEVLVCRPKNAAHSLAIVHFLNTRFGYVQVQRAVRGMTAHLYSEDMADVLVPPYRKEFAGYDALLLELTSTWRRAEHLTAMAIANVEGVVRGTLDEAKCIEEGRQLADEFGWEAPQ